MRVIDCEGHERDMGYLRAKYGAFFLVPATPAPGPLYRVTTLREKVNTAASLVVTVRDRDGRPIAGERVAWYWDDADPDPDAGPLDGVLPWMRPGRAVSGWTNEEGDTGFGMGRGAYFFPQEGQVGPHGVWIHGAGTRSDLLYGLGMLGQTAHDHFDVEFTLFEYGGGPEPPDGEGTKMKIYDENGVEKNLAWLVDLYGAQVVNDPGKTDQFELVEVAAVYGEEKVLTVTVEDVDGGPLAGIEVGLGPRNVAGATQRQVTGVDGKAYFPMDDSHRYYVTGPESQGAWACGVVPPAVGQVYEAAGWVFLGKRKPGRWLNLTFQRVIRGEPIPGPVDPGNWPRAELLVFAEQVEHTANELDVQVARLRGMAAEMRALAG